MFLYQKLIDRSTLRQGFQMPVEYHDLLKAMPEGMPKHGETRNISKNLSFCFPNGLVEKVKLDKHLNVG